MNNVFVGISAILVLAGSSFAQEQGQRGQGQRGQGQRQGSAQGRNQVISIPENVLRDSLPVDSKKLDSLVADAKVFQSVNLPLGALLELKLTAEQRKSLNALAEQSNTKTRELIQNGDREGAMAIREQMSTKVSELLTSEQKKIVEKYPSARMGGNRGQGGRGPGGGRGGNPPSFLN